MTIKKIGICLLNCSNYQTPAANGTEWKLNALNPGPIGNTASQIPTEPLL